MQAAAEIKTALRHSSTRRVESFTYVAREMIYLSFNLCSLFFLMLTRTPHTQRVKSAQMAASPSKINYHHKLHNEKWLWLILLKALIYHKGNDTASSGIFNGN